MKTPYQILKLFEAGLISRKEAEDALRPLNRGLTTPTFRNGFAPVKIITLKCIG